ncbi:MAG: UbiH/UbiF/VisC/COQ6 family ubiquinone biosynthesis hydroxylase [Alphaproteobacteria bacterium]|nr:UbiH/UbiF/VisC/COQ6 family ubiquinone biosynthesis hydroxylase [Alphaproteobacteria bacterium]
MATTQSGHAAHTVETVIIGGGFVGLALGAALAEAGMETAVVDREPPATALDPAFDGRASAIAYGSRRILEGIGLWPLVAEAAAPILDIRVVDGGSPLFLHYDHRDVGDEPLGHIVENRVIRHGLHRLAAGLPRLLHLAPRGVAGLERDAWGVTLRLDDGAAIRARLAVAADGKRSAVRQAAGIGVTEVPYGQTAIVLTVAHALPHRNVAIEHFLPAGPFAILPLPGDATAPDRSSLVWTERADLVPGILALDEEPFAAELARRFGDHWGAVRAVGPRFSYPLGLQWAQRVVDHRLALVGDAAHVIHPIAGQGLNLGIRDVAALAEALVDARRLGLDIGAPEALRRYAGRRHLDTVMLAATTDALNRLFSNDLPPLRAARRVGLAAVDRLPALKRFFMRHAMGVVGDLPRLARGEPL